MITLNIVQKLQPKSELFSLERSYSSKREKNKTVLVNPGFPIPGATNIPLRCGGNGFLQDSNLNHILKSVKYSAK